MDRAVIGSGSIICAGSLVGIGRQVPAGELWGGMPAKYIRKVTKYDEEKIIQLVMENTALFLQHRHEMNKSFDEIDAEEYEYDQRVNRSDVYYKRMTKEQLAEKLGEFEHHTVPGRIFDSAVSSRTHPPSRPKD